MSLSFRPMGVLDLDLAAAFHRAAFSAMGERAWTHRDMAELMASPGVGGAFVLGDGAELGVALWRVVADEAELLTIAVEDARRRRGAGRALLEQVIECVQAAGVRSLFLEVGADNPAACALYEQKDFRVVGRRPAYYQRGERPAADALVMRLNLKLAE